MTTSEEFQFTTMEAERLREQVRQLEADLRSKGDECRHYAEKCDRLESERDSWRRISERLEAENKRLRELLVSLHVKIALPLNDDIADRKAMMAEIDAELEGVQDDSLSERLAILDGRSNSNESWMEGSIAGDEYVAIAREAVAQIADRDELLNRAARMFRAMRYCIQLADGTPLDQWLADYETMTKETT